MKSDFFMNNRRRLYESLEAGLIVMAGWTHMQWHGDTTIPFRQEANFWYLTGIEHADWRLIIDVDQEKTWLIAPEIDEVHQLFDGSLDFGAAKKISGADEVLGSRVGNELLATLAKKHNTVYTLIAPSSIKHTGFVPNPAPETLRRELDDIFSTVKDCRAVLSRLRAIKQPEEIKKMQQAALLSVEAINRARNKVQPGTYEYTVEAELGYYYRCHNAQHAFDPIVASGKNACTLHYVVNTSGLRTRQLLLIDSGARLNGYSTDITRTFAVGEPTLRQRTIHEAVQVAERQIIGLLRPGIAIRDYLESADAVMKDTLMSLGLMENKDDTIAYRRYFPHAISHGLGVDVHESLGGYSEFRPGMVLTVEPGVYIPEEDIGVRIEDSILITDSTIKNLTGSLSTDL